jgi:hypothetical protein
MLPDRPEGSENGLVEALVRMVSTGASTSPLENNGEVGIRRHDADDLSDPFHRTGLESNVLDTRIS